MTVGRQAGEFGVWVGRIKAHHVYKEGREEVGEGEGVCMQWGRRKCLCHLVMHEAPHVNTT